MGEVWSNDARLANPGSGDGMGDQDGPRASLGVVPPPPSGGTA